MRYGLTRLVIGCRQFVAITEEEYNSIRVAREGIFQALYIEEKLDLLLENYAEFERELLNQSLTGLLFSIRDWSGLMDHLYLINRRIVNLLTTCRLFIDQIPHALNRLYGTGPMEFIGRRFSEEYDGRLGYRALEAMRNYVQHRDLPVHHLSFQRWRDPEDKVGLGKSTVTPSVNTIMLEEDKKFKASVLAELKPYGEHVDLKPLVREYMEGMTSVHQSVRELLAADIHKWETVIEKTIQRFTKDYPETIIGLAAVLEDAQGVYPESVSIFDDPIKRRRWLEHKNRAFPYSKHAVTNEVRAGST